MSTAFASLASNVVWSLRQVVAVVFLTALLGLAFARELTSLFAPRPKHLARNRSSSTSLEEQQQDSSTSLGPSASLSSSSSSSGSLKAKQPLNERVVPHIDYYVHLHGLHYERHRAVTADGFVLYLHRIRAHETVAAGAGARPVVMQHGLFMDPGMYVVNEEESMAFSLANEGYDVWLGSNRGVVLEHDSLHPSQDAFWDWSVDDLAKYDVRCIVDYVLGQTGQSKVAWVGMSQGNAQAFMAFSTNKALAEKIALFVAIAPVARLGDLPTWGLKHVSSLTPEKRELVFGKGEFVPMLCLPGPYVPPSLFVWLGYPVFNYLFTWSDTNWDKSRKPKYFQFTPRPQSVKLISHWCEMSLTKRSQRYSGIHGVAGEAYPIEQMACPLAIFHGGQDFLADCRSLVSHLETHKFDRLRHVEIVEHHEHLDLVWAVDAEERVTKPILKLLRDEPSWMSEPDHSS